ncbi:MAG: NTP transferase domain-containing protein [Candidatus Diapherotrites archaeon]|nr:NTP transferase domain-containing protein [Candidatus Diapherotrites archaeon]
MTDMQAVILAAGASSRFYPFSEESHKAMFRVMGKPLIDYTLESLSRAGVEEVIIVLSPGQNLDIKTELKLRFVVQEKPEGMGDALQRCTGLDGEFLLLSPYHFNADEFIKPMLKKAAETGADAVLVAQETSMPWRYGMLGLDGDKAVKIVEKPERGKEPSNKKALSIYLLPDDFLSYLNKVKKHQYSFEDALQLMMKEKDVRVIESEAESLSVKYPWDVLDAVRKLERRFLKRKIADNAEIAKSAKINGDVYVGERARILDNAVVNGPCYIGDGCVVGNNALVRDFCDLEPGVVVGANTEVKGSYLGENTHIHSGYVGDSVIGSGCRIGAGFVTANRRVDRGEIMAVVKGKQVNTGLSFLGAIIGNKVSIGVQSSVMPGKIIGNRSVVWPKTAVTKNVGSDALCKSNVKTIVEGK